MDIDLKLKSLYKSQKKIKTNNIKQKNIIKESKIHFNPITSILSIPKKLIQQMNQSQNSSIKIKVKKPQKNLKLLNNLVKVEEKIDFKVKENNGIEEELFQKIKVEE